LIPAKRSIDIYINFVRQQYDKEGLSLLQNNNVDQYKVGVGEQTIEIQVERNLLRFINNNVINEIQKKLGVQVYITDKSSTSG
jgi:hypothetical protein